MDIMVDVMMPVYNQERFLAQGIESIVNQKTNFNFRLIIGEDCSKDSSRLIIEKYAKLYPEKVFPIYNEKNLGSNANSTNIYLTTDAKYIAICEGDDYWIDNNKLQKQVDFMEANPDFSMCFSDVEVINELKQEVEFYPKWSKDVFEFEDFVLSPINIIPTPSLLFRNFLPRPFPAFYNNALGGDMITQLLLADKGKGKFFSERMAAYRNHAGGITKTQKHIEQHTIALKRTYDDLNQYFNYKYDKIFKKRFLAIAKINMFDGLVGKRGIAKLKHYFKSMPEYVKYSDKIDYKELFRYHIIFFLPFLLKEKKY